MEKREEVEMALRVRHVEQQIAERLAPELKQFAGPPMQMQYYGTRVQTFRENPELQPTDAYMRWATTALQRELATESVRVPVHELHEIARQEWHTDMTRSVLQARLNRHQSADGPSVRRSANGVLYVSAESEQRQRRNKKTPPLDAIATPKTADRRRNT